MSDNLVKHLRDSKGWPTLGHAAADRIEELGVKLTKAEEALDRIQDGSYGKLAAIARATLAELKGETE